MLTSNSTPKISVYQIKIMLRHVEPAVWRQLLVEADTTLGDLHLIANVAMGWADAHPHAFVVGEKTYGEPELGSPTATPFDDERMVQLATIVRSGDKFTYHYDFGDDWLHEILVEKELPADERFSYPRCIGGARACPPEDCGGPPGYAHLLEVLGKNRGTEYDELLTWLGGYFDPEGFDANRINADLEAVCSCAGCDCENCDCEDHAVN